MPKTYGQAIAAEALMKIPSPAGLLACALVLVLPCRLAVSDEPVTVFAAASLADALESAGRLFSEKTGRTVRFSFASSSTLARQISAGAPADIFISANEAWMNELAARNFIDSEFRISPTGNDLVLIAPTNSSLKAAPIDASLDITRLLGDGRLAIGDPAHVPAGIYARQALKTLNLWPAVEKRLAPTGNVRAALSLVERGEVPLGIVYGTDAKLSRRVMILGAFPEGSHPPIIYPFAIVKSHTRPSVVLFFAFLTGPQGRAVFDNFGFPRHPTVDGR
jgi:molybdate transport system substrate-binding protein